MSTLIPILIPVLMSAVAMIVVLVREGQFQQLAAMQEARQAEVSALRQEVGAATANALSALQRASETQRRLEGAEAESLDLRERLGAVTFQLGQERTQRGAAEAQAQEFQARSLELERQTLGLERQRQKLVTQNGIGEARAVAAEAEVAALQQRVAQLLEELRQVRQAHEGTEAALRTAAAAAEVARVEQTIHTQTEELLAALATLRRETAGFLAVGPPPPATDDQAPAMPDAGTEEATSPYTIPRLAWTPPEPAEELRLTVFGS